MDALDLAGYVVKYGIDNSVPVTNLQLQKILYFLQIRSLQEDADAPVIEHPNFEAWKFGPVIKKVYDKFCLSGGLQIIFYPQDVNTSATIAPYLEDCLNKLCKVRSWKLVDFAHRSDGAWSKSYIENQKEKIPDSYILNEAKSLDKNFIELI